MASSVSFDSSLSSGLHRYRGDSDKLKFRLIFTDYQLLSSRPVTRNNLSSETDYQGERTNSKEKEKRPFDYHSSFLIVKHQDKWITKPEGKCLFLNKESGFRLRVVSEALKCGCCESCRRSKSKSSLNGEEDLRLDKASNLHSSHHNSIGTTGIGLIKSERASYWKDTTTTTVTSDNDNNINDNLRQRTFARKLPKEMRNHLQDAQYLYHKIQQCIAHGHLDRRRGYVSRCSCAQVVSLDCCKQIEIEMEEKDESYELKDWYRLWLLDKKQNLLDTKIPNGRARRNKMLSQSRDNCNAFVRGDDTVEATGRAKQNVSATISALVGANNKQPLDEVDLISKSANDSVNRLIDHAQDNIANPIVSIETSLNPRIETDSGQLENESNWETEKIHVVSPPTTGRLRDCAHGEILYLIMEKHEIADEIVIKNLASTSPVEGDTVVTANTTNATLLFDQTFTDKSDDVQREVHKQQQQQEQVLQNLVDQSDTKIIKPDDERKADKINDNEAMAAEISLLNRQSSFNIADGVANTIVGQSSNEGQSREIKQKTSIQFQETRMPQKQLRRQRTWLDSTNDESKVACLGVVVIDVLNRFIQLKPDLNELISINVCSNELELCDNAIKYNSNNRNERGDNEDSGSYHNQSDNCSLSRDFCLSSKATAIPSNLLYQIEIASENDPTIANNELNLLMNQLLNDPLKDSKPFGGFLGPMNGSVLLKLQVNFHYASEFSKDCCNLYVKYKFITKNSGSKWKLRRQYSDEAVLVAAEQRMRMKDDIWASDSACLNRVTAATRGKNLAQMTHGFASQENDPERNTLICSDCSEKPSHKSILQQFDNHELSNTDDDDYTCLLHGSTITSWPNSKGRFHFACVEQLIIEAIPATTATNSINRRLPSFHLLSSTSESYYSSTTNTTDIIRRKSSVSRISNNNEDVEPKLDSVTSSNINNDAQIQEGSPNKPLLAQSEPNLRSRADKEPQIDNVNQQFESSEFASTLKASVDSGARIGEKSRGNSASIDPDCEIVILLEFYSRDFYHDKLQGWTHLTVPINMDIAENIKPRLRPMFSNQQDESTSLKGHCTRYELPVIIPQLCSPIDRLLYYLNSYMPKSTPKLESFARSNRRYMLQTKQSGYVVLDCEIVRQFSDPNFDSALTELMGVGQQSERTPFEAQLIGNQATNDPFDLPMIGGSIDSQGRLDTERVVKVYQKAKERLEKLNVNSSVADQ